MGNSEVSMKEGSTVELKKIGCAGWWYVRVLGKCSILTQLFDTSLCLLQKNFILSSSLHLLAKFIDFSKLLSTENKLSEIESNEEKKLKTSIFKVLTSS